MEKLYEVDTCRLKLINKECGLSQYVKEKMDEKIICIKDEDCYININTNETYSYLKNDFNHIISCASELSSSLEKKIFAINVALYEKEDLSENDVAIYYLKAIKARRILDERKNFHGTIQKQKIKVG